MKARIMRSYSPAAMPRWLATRCSSGIGPRLPVDRHGVRRAPPPTDTTHPVQVARAAPVGWRNRPPEAAGSALAREGAAGAPAGLPPWMPDVPHDSVQLG